ncbi:hypothetical protein E2C01_005697 [Portunus trituberculatus]|uniref:Uncharacterized protein n=1 Tax=Portunus trituberculatus TaxID=210409 RepID=A0A5B7CU41_PORTR|nr:hypothetical protein [Portunus trituberculatus]
MKVRAGYPRDTSLSKFPLTATSLLLASPGRLCPSSNLYLFLYTGRSPRSDSNRILKVPPPLQVASANNCVSTRARGWKRKRFGDEHLVGRFAATKETRVGEARGKRDEDGHAL